MKRKLTDNIPLKVMSIVVAILVWLIVVNIDNPTVTRYYTVPEVELLNQAYVEDWGVMCLQDDKQESVRVAITAERKTLSRIKASDIHAVADLQQLVNRKTKPVMVPIIATCDGIAPENIKVTPQNLGVYLEEKVTQEFSVNVDLGESKPGKGFEIGTKTSSPGKIRITGPVSLMNKIDTVSTTSMSVEGKTEDIVEESGLNIIDKNGEKLTDTEMNNLRFENNAKVTVIVKLWKVATDVKINVPEWTGEPADGYQVEENGITTVPATISVAGTDEALEELKQMGNAIWIPKESVDVSGKSSDVEKKINLTELLPEGVKLTSGTSEDLWIRVSILPIGSHSYNVSTKGIESDNLQDGLQVAFDTDKIEIRVKAVEGSLEDFDEEKVKASIDLKDKEEGSYEVPVTIVLPEGYELVDEVNAEIKISKVSTIEESNE